MRIGVYSRYLGRSQKTGIEEYAEQVIRRLVRFPGHEYFLLGDGERRFAGEGISDVRIESRGRIGPLLAEVGRIVRERALDAIYMPTQYTYFARRQHSAVTAFDFAWRPYPEYFPASRRLAFEFSARYMAKRATKILAISEATRKDLVELYRCDPSKVMVAHLGYDAEAYSPAPSPGDAGTLARRGLSPKGYLLFLGTLQKRKNVINLVKAYGACRSALPLVLAGGKGWFYREIKEEIERSPRRSEIIELGYVPDGDKPALYRGCGAFVYPSLYEGFGLPVLEAMACGCAVMTSNVSSLPEVIGDAGFAVDPNDIEAMAAAMDGCGAGLAEALGRKAAARAKLFSWDDTAAKTLRAIEESARGTNALDAR